MGTVLDSHFLALTAIVTVGYQLLFFIITALLRFDKVTDFAGSTNFVIIAILTLVLKGAWHFRQIVLTVLVTIWGLRLGLFLLMRILQWGEDRRFDKMRDNLGKLAFFWTFQSSADKRYGQLEEYRVYKNTTSPLIPLPPAVYGALPAWFKAAFLLELPLYNPGPGGDPIS
nr:unnamed protein product [Digitaria exilis]